MSQAAPTASDAIEQISQIITKITGVQLGASQRHMVEGRISRRMIQVNVKSYDEYLEYYKKHEVEERNNLISLLTTHHTFFFREFPHFDYLAQKALPDLIAKMRKKGENTIRVWSAACSRGQEVYSLAMFLDYHIPRLAPDFKYEILGTDVDPESVKIGANGVYHRNEIKQVPLVYLGQHWVRGTGDIADFVKVKKTLRERCTFKPGNLFQLDPSYIARNSHIIFVRNVFIYFTPEQIKAISQSLLKGLHPDGYLFIGTSETLMNMGLAIESPSPAIYRHTMPGAPKAPTVVPKDTAVERKDKGPIRVFCIDDSPTIHSLLKKILDREQGFEIVGTAANGVEAAQKLKLLKADVVTLDIHMPVQGGIEYLEKNYNMSHAPVVMISSVSREDSKLAMKSLTLGASDYVEKPALNNLAERGEEIRTKIRCAFQAKQTPAVNSLKVDKAFAKKATIPKPEEKAVAAFCNLADREKLIPFLRDADQGFPPLFVFFEGSEGILPELANTLTAALKRPVLHLTDPAVKAQPNDIYLVDFKKHFDAIRQSYQSRKSALVVFGEVSPHAGAQIIQWSNPTLLLEEIRDGKGTKSLTEVATDISPATSFAYSVVDFLGRTS